MKRVPGGFIRKGRTEGKVTIHLRHSKDNGEFNLTTRVIKSPDDPNSEIVRQTKYPENSFPWKDVFLCGYGTHRAGWADASHEKYALRDAVSTLFDSKAALQNPELVLLRQSPEVREKLEAKLMKILMLDESMESLIETDDSAKALSVKGPWGTFPFDVLSDGYRSTSQWILDFFGWSVYNGRLGFDLEIAGVVLIDEIEQHLHPRWQRHMLSRLRQQFPNVQFIVTTHAPMCVVGAAELKSNECEIVVLRSDEDKVVALQNGKLPRGQRADQVLTSYLFGLPTAGDSANREAIHKFAELLSRPTDLLNPDDQDELERLERYLDRTIGAAESEFEQEIVDAVQKVLHERSAAQVGSAPRKRATELATLTTLREIVDSWKK
jgi:hypothetical protein